MSGELTVAIHNGLRKSAKEVLDHEDDLRKSAKNADEAIEELKKVAKESGLNTSKRAKRVARTAPVGDINKSFFENANIKFKIEEGLGLIPDSADLQSMPIKYSKQER